MEKDGKRYIGGGNFVLIPDFIRQYDVRKSLKIVTSIIVLHVCIFILQAISEVSILRTQITSGGVT